MIHGMYASLSEASKSVYQAVNNSGPTWMSIIIQSIRVVINFGPRTSDRIQLEIVEGDGLTQPMKVASSTELRWTNDAEEFERRFVAAFNKLIIQQVHST